LLQPVTLCFSLFHFRLRGHRQDALLDRGEEVFNLPLHLRQSALQFVVVGSDSVIAKQPDDFTFNAQAGFAR